MATETPTPRQAQRTTAQGFSSSLDLPFPGADKTKRTFKPGKAAWEFSKGILLTLAWSDENPAAALAVEAWNVILKVVKSLLRLFRELNIFAVIL